MSDPQSDAMNDAHALSGAYALGALGDTERAVFEEHLQRCAACRDEVDGLREAAAALANDAAAEPPAGLRDRVLAGIEAVRPLPPVASGDPHVAPRPVRRHWTPRAPRTLLVAAAVLLVVGIAGAVWQPWSQGPDDPPTASERVLEAEDATRTTLSLPGGAKATVVVSRSEGRAVLVTEDMAPAPPGKDYELWLQTPDGVMVPAGLMPDDRDATVLLEGDASEATAAGITVEPDGGSPQPTSDPIALFELRRA